MEKNLNLFWYGWEEPCTECAYPIMNMLASDDMQLGAHCYNCGHWELNPETKLTKFQKALKDVDFFTDHCLVISKEMYTRDQAFNLFKWYVKKNMAKEIEVIKHMKESHVNHTAVTYEKQGREEMLRFVDTDKEKESKKHYSVWVMSLQDAAMCSNFTQKKDGASQCGICKREFPF